MADRLSAVNLSNDSHQTRVVQPANGIPTFRLNENAV